jgi:uncharacterized protein YciI
MSPAPLLLWWWLQEIKAFIDADPYVKNGLVTGWYALEHEH